MEKMAEPVAGLDKEVTEFRQREIAKSADATKATAEKQYKMGLTADKNNGMLQIAKRIARELAQHGPITIDDVTVKMAEKYNVMPSKLKDKKEQRWKGAIFSSAEWVMVGSQPSILKSSHGRIIGLWALKTWLKDHTLNGKESHVSSFVLTKIFSDFKRANPGRDVSLCQWFIGEAVLSPDCKREIASAGDKLYGVPVVFMPNSVGAVLKY